MNYDTIIVGAGSAGAILAARLTEDPRRSVLLLEAGPDYPDPESLPDEIKYGYGVDRNLWARAFGDASTHNWGYHARASSKSPRIAVPRGKLVGGSSAINAQIYLRGVPEDYDGWAALGNDGWAYRDLLQHFRKIENDADFDGDFHGSDGPIPVRRWPESEMIPDQVAFYAACLALGYEDSKDQNHPDSTGIGPVPFNNPGGIRWSTAMAYVDPARYRLNLTVRPDTFVRSVVIDNARATGVIAESGGELFAMQGSEVVLACGAYASPQLLMLSGVGPAAQLEQHGISTIVDLPGVGENLRDHPQVQLTWKTNPGYEDDPLAPRIQNALRYTATGSRSRNDMFIHPLALATETGLYSVSSGEESGVGMIIAIYLADGAGTVTLRSADPETPPEIDFNYLAGANDRNRFREAVRICLKLAEHDSYRQILDKLVSPTAEDLSSDDALDDWLLRSVRTSHHGSGTCKMGPASDPMAVVGNTGRVHGMQGLRVADASIMPDCIRANTNATAMVIGERIAAFILAGE